MKTQETSRTVFYSWMAVETCVSGDKACLLRLLVQNIDV